MRNSDHPLFQAGRRLSEWLDEVAIPIDDPLGQLVWATVLRSGESYAAISHLVGNELDTQAAMLGRPLFEDVVIAHWLSYNRDDSGWLVERFFRHRETLALVQADLEGRHNWSLGPSLVTDLDAIKQRQNALFKEFKRGVRNWWDPGEDGRGGGRDIGLSGVARILQESADRHERFAPRFGGGEEPLLRRWDEVLNRWYAQQLHHTAIGLPFQPEPAGPVIFADGAALVSGAFRILFTAYWMYGQQIFLVYDHFGGDVSTYEKVFLQGLHEHGALLGVEHEFKPWSPG